MELPRRLVPFGVACALSVSVAGAGAASGPAADPRVEWLREHAVALSTVDPAASGFDDLEPLKEVLAGVRVVMLGEATRGDGSAFLAKTRLIRFLHSEMGFDILALECGFHACHRSWQEIRGGAAPREALTPALSSLYTESVQLRPLFDLLARQRATARPLAVAGFEPQLSGDGTALLGELRAVLEGAGSPPEEIPGFARMVEVVRRAAGGAYLSGEEPAPPKRARERFHRTLEEVERRLASEEAGEEAPGEADEGAEAGAPPAVGTVDLWRQVFDNLDAAVELAWEQGAYDPAEAGSPELTNLRNRKMAENLLWLTSRLGRGSKMVVWSLDVLLARELGLLETGDLAMKDRLERFVTVGDLVHGALGDEVYTVGVTALRGHSGTPFREPYALFEPTPGSFEELMGRSGLEAAFVDLRGVPEEDGQGGWLRGPVIARPVSYVELRGSWPRHLDGLLFLRTMEPSRADSTPSPPPSRDPAPAESFGAGH